MARIARFVVPGLPYRATQRGNRRETVCFSDVDYELNRDLLRQQRRKHGVAVWSYCLMPNHVHLILVQIAPGGWSGVRRDASAL
jgi:putative transposase